MGAKDAFKKFIPPIVLDAVRWARGRDERSELQQYLRNGRIPWSQGYGMYKRNLVMRLMGDSAVLEQFRHGRPLNDHYGVGVDERCIEYPWIVSHLSDGPAMLLDAGAALNHDYILAHQTFRNKHIHVMTLAPETAFIWRSGISYLFSDLRDIPIRDSYYDAVICISTLEHVGCNNVVYTKHASDDQYQPGDFAIAVKEMARVLKPGGSLYLTVPFGVYGHYRFFQQFDRHMLSQAICAFGQYRQANAVFYRYNPTGWRIAAVEECADCEYVQWFARACEQGRRPQPVPLEPDSAAAARAVACVQIVKG